MAPFLPRRQASVWDDILHILYVNGVGNDFAATCLVKLALAHAFSASALDPIAEEAEIAPGIARPGIAEELAPAAPGLKWIRDMDHQL